MFVLVSYDVNTMDKLGRTRLRKIAKTCVNYGQRVQNSVFEINISYGDFLKVKGKLLELMNEEKDSLRFYYLGNNWQGKLEHYGIKESYNPDGVFII